MGFLFYLEHFEDYLYSFRRYFFRSRLSLPYWEIKLRLFKRLSIS